jgi:cysteine desulfurase
MGMTEEDAKSSIRFSFGFYTKEEDIFYTIEKLKEIIKKLRD